MRVLVIGGTRFMGPEVVRLLAEQGHEVTVFHRGNNQGEPPAGVRRIQGDRHQLLDHAEALRALKPDVVLDMVLVTEANAVDLMETFAGAAQRVVGISSQDVYRNYGLLISREEGEPDPLPLTEEGPLRTRLYPYRGDQPRQADDPARHMDDYDKILVERAVMGRPELPGTVLRLPAVYGPRDFQRRLYPWLKRMDDGRPAIILDEGFAHWTWTRGYMEDMAAAIALCVTDERAAGRIYNVGDPRPVSTLEWVRALARVVGYAGQILTVPAADLPEKLRVKMRTEVSLVTDSTRIRTELGFAERVSPEEAIARTVAWDRANPPATLNPDQYDYAAEDQVLASVR